MKKLLLFIWLFLLGVVLISGCGGGGGTNDPFITKVAAGSNHTIALTNGGLVYAWGKNDQGQLGNGTNTDSNVPVKVNLPAGMVIVAIAAGGSHNLAITGNHEVYAWGANDYGQLGDGTKTARSTPVKITGLNEIYLVSAGGSHSMSIQTGGYMWLWGNNNSRQLGIDTITERLTPAKYDTAAALSSGVKAIAAGGNHSLAIANNYFIYAWGANDHFQVGGVGGSYRATPDTIKTAPTGAGAIIGQIIAAGESFSLAVNSSVTSVYAWGSNGYGQTGINTPETYDCAYPLQATGSDGTGYLTGVTAIAAGGEFTIAQTNATTVYGWGKNSRGQLAQGFSGSSIYVPTLLTHLPTGASITGIAAGANHAALVTGNGKVYTWGLNANGQLGNGSYSDGLAPGAVKW